MQQFLQIVLNKFFFLRKIYFITIDWLNYLIVYKVLGSIS